MPKHFFTIIILALILPACAQMRTSQVDTGPAPQTAVQEPKQTKVVDNQPKTIDDYRAEYARNPHNKELVKEYVKSLEEMKKSADRELEKEDFSSAGKGYKMLHKNFADFKNFAHMLSFDKAKLNIKLAICKDALSKKGFQEYRKGNLNHAILLWQDYLAIDPYNADIKKASPQQNYNRKTFSTLINKLSTSEIPAD